MRVIAALSLAFLLAAHGSQAATAQGNRMAYDATLKCVTANGLAKLDERDAHHPDRMAEYETKTRRAFDLAYTLGAKAGLSDKQVLHDLHAAVDTELSHMMRNRDYYATVVATCKAMGLM